MLTFHRNFIGLLIVSLCLMCTSAYAVSDIQITLDANGITDYSLTSVSSDEIFSGDLPANDPTMNLQVGTRYGITNNNPSFHPFEVIAKGDGPTDDVVLLSQGTDASMEANADINWVEDGNLVEFTLTSELVNAMNQDDNLPGYRCGVHVANMRGDFEISQNGDGGQEIEDPLPDIPQGDVAIELESIMDGLTSPVSLKQTADGRIFVVDQVGFVYILENGNPVDQPFLDVSDRIVDLNESYDERGLIGLAFHPDFVNNGKIYTHTSEPVNGEADFTTTLPREEHNNQTVIAEWTVSEDNPNLIDPNSRRELLRINQPQSNHAGGSINFGQDGFLYITLGDGGEADDQGPGHVEGGNAQETSNIYGNILRIDVDGTNSANGQYGIPADNPFVGEEGLDEIFAYGFRNPYSMSFDQDTGDMYVGDAGQNDVEEIDIVTIGGNYGWNVKEGSFFFNPNGENDGFITTEPVQPVPDNLIDPIAEYDHDDGLVVVAGYVYRGTAIPALQGHFIAADFGTEFDSPSGRLFYLDDSNNFQEFQIGTENRDFGYYVKGFGQDQNGEVYVAVTQELGPTGSTGEILRIVPVDTNVSSWLKH